MPRGAEPANAALRVVVELAGDEASVERDAAWCSSELDAKPAPASVLERLRELQGSTPDGRGLRFRIAVLPSRCEAALSRLWRAGADVLGHPGIGLVYASFALPAGEDPAALAAVFRCVDDVVAAGAGAVVLEAAPAWAKRGRDVFGDLAGALPLARRLKRLFDPDGLLNPGRYAGHL